MKYYKTALHRIDFTSTYINHDAPNFDVFAPLPEPVPPAQTHKLSTQALLLRFHGGSRVRVSPPRAKGLL